MEIKDFYGCCRAAIICQFGGGHQRQIEGYTKQAVIDGMIENLDFLKNQGIAVVFCALTTTQPNAIAALQELGFYGYNNVGAKDAATRGAGKHNIFPFFLPLAEWDSKIFSKRYDPKQDSYKNKECENKSFNYEVEIQERYW